MPPKRTDVRALRTMINEARSCTKTAKTLATATRGWQLSAYEAGTGLRCWPSLAGNAMLLIGKLRIATAANSTFQLTTDGLVSYLAAVDEFLGDRVDYAQLIKSDGAPHDGEQRYSPAEYVGSKKVPVIGEILIRSSFPRPTWSVRISRCA
jgi:hypothetical protein